MACPACDRPCGYRHARPVCHHREFRSSRVCLTMSTDEGRMMKDEGQTNFRPSSFVLRRLSISLGFLELALNHIIAAGAIAGPAGVAGGAAAARGAAHIGTAGR